MTASVPGNSQISMRPLPPSRLPWQGQHVTPPPWRIKRSHRGSNKNVKPLHPVIRSASSRGTVPKPGIPNLISASLEGSGRVPV